MEVKDFTLADQAGWELAQVDQLVEAGLSRELSKRLTADLARAIREVSAVFNSQWEDGSEKPLGNLDEALFLRSSLALWLVHQFTDFTNASILGQALSIRCLINRENTNV